VSYDFDGSSEYFISTASALTAVSTSLPFSAAFWFYNNTASGEDTGWAVGPVSGSGQKHALYTFNDTVRALTRTTSNGIAVATGTIATNTWTHAAGRWLATNSRAAYRDGGNEGTNTSNKSISAAAQSLVAKEPGGTSGKMFDGRICELAVWNVDIGTDAIAELAKGFSPLLVHPSGLVDYWPMVRHSRGIVGGINWTETGAPPIAEHTRVFMPSRPQIGLAPFVAPPAGGIIPEIMHHRKQMQAA